MITLIAILLILIVLLLTVSMFLAYLAWQKIFIFLTYNTRYETVEYERAITTPKPKKHASNPSQTKQRGRAITPVDDLIDIDKIDFDIAAKAIEAMGE